MNIFKKNINTILITLALFGISQVVFLHNIERPEKVVYDEFHYIPAAKKIFTPATPTKRLINTEHPPLAKMIIYSGIKLFGDNSFGWRIMSSLFGGLTLIAFYFLGLIIFRSQVTALIISTLTISNHLLFVQSRTAMLDTFMFTFIAIGLAFFAKVFFSQNNKLKKHSEKQPNKHQEKYLALTGILIGLATSCKWVGLVAIGLTFTITLLAKRPFSNILKIKGFTLIEEITIPKIILYLLILPVLTYFAVTFPHYYFVTPDNSSLKYFSYQADMWEMLSSIKAGHSYGSQWWQWPILQRPMWYFFSRKANLSQGVVLLGNPLIMWTGLLAVLYTTWSFFKSRSKESFFSIILYFGFLFCWAVVPRNLSFYYYYYPAGMLLALSFGHTYQQCFKQKRATKIVALVFVLLSVLVMFYFYPVLSARKFSSPHLYIWMWFRSWI